MFAGQVVLDAVVLGGGQEAIIENEFSDLAIDEFLEAGYILAVSSTFAGNLLIVGSIANIIVAGEAERMGIPFDWKQHALVGVPVTLISLAAGLACLWLF